MLGSEKISLMEILGSAYSPAKTLQNELAMFDENWPIQSKDTIV